MGLFESSLEAVRKSSLTNYTTSDHPRPVQERRLDTRRNGLLRAEREEVGRGRTRHAEVLQS